MINSIYGIKLIQPLVIKESSKPKIKKGGAMSPTMAMKGLFSNESSFKANTLDRKENLSNTNLLVINESRRFKNWMS
jgi:hypothetical protein